LIGKEGARREIAFSKRVSDAIFGISGTLEALLSDKRHVSSQRDQYGGALRGNSAFKRLLDRTANHLDPSLLIQEGFLPVGQGVLEFTISDAIYIFEGMKSETYTVESIIRTEDMYLREDVSMESTFKVPNIPLSTIGSMGPVVRYTSAKTGLYEVSSTMLEWCERLFTKLKIERILWQSPIPRDRLLSLYAEDREWVNDDTGLIGLISRHMAGKTKVDTVILVSSDRKLARQAAKSANCRVLRAEPKGVIQCFPSKVWGQVWDDLPYETLWSRRDLSQMEQNRPSAVFFDTGSMAAACSKLESVEVGSQRIIYSKELIQAGRHPSTNLRYSTCRLQPVTQEYLQFEVFYPMQDTRGGHVKAKPPRGRHK
jgi:hypothetical protein